MAGWQRTRLVAAVSLASTLVTLGAGVAVQGQPALPPAPDRPLGFLHAGPVSGPSGLHQVVDQNGREVLLKGVNTDGITDYFRGGAPSAGHPVTPAQLQTPYSINPADYTGGSCVPDVKEVEGVPLCSLDFAQMRPLGYNMIRLTLSWSLLEPTVNGGIDQTYMNRIAQVVAWAKSQGIYSLLDLHQDAWSKYDYTNSGDMSSCAGPLSPIQGYDGAPLWASRQNPVIPACALGGVREFDAAVQNDFRGLYDASKPASPNEGPLFIHFRNVFLALANRFHDEPAVAGYEIFNEPSPGFVPTGGVFDETELFHMDGKIIDYVVANVQNFRQLFFVEPNALRNFTDQGLITTPWSLYSAYPNVVFTPHIYTGVFTLDQTVLHQHIYPNNGGYNSSIQDASFLGLPLFISEFGNSPPDDNTILRNHYQLQDMDQVGGTLWLWKENANDVFGNSQWGVYYGDFSKGDTHGLPSPTRIKYTARAFPLFTAGHLQNFVYNPDNAAFDLHATSPPVARDAAAHNSGTLLFVPAASTCAIQSENATLEVFDRGGGSREAYAYPLGGDYRVFCGDVNAGKGPGPGRGNSGNEGNGAGSGGSLPNTSR